MLFLLKKVLRNGGLGYSVWAGLVLFSFFYGQSISCADETNNIAIHGFGGWAYGLTDNENRYLVGNEDGNYNNVNFSLNFSATVSDNFRVQFQSSYIESFEQNEVGLGYAFAEWYFTDSFIFRAGQIKAPFMIYTEIYDVGTLRPFYTLPQGVYRDFAAESYKGFGLTGSCYAGDGWEILYDLYSGKVDLLPYRTVYFLTLKETMHQDPEALFVTSTWYAKDVAGFRLTLDMPFKGFSASLSSFSGSGGYDIEFGSIVLEQHEFKRYTFFGLSIEYLKDRWWVRYESLVNSEDEVYINTSYIEVAYKVTEHWQIAFRIESLKEEYDEHFLNDKGLIELFEEHKDVCLGINYWFSQNLVMKCSLHFVDGNRFANPDQLENFEDNLLTGYFEEQTSLLLMGAQFSF